MTGGPAPRIPRADPVLVPLEPHLVPATRALLERRPLQNLYFLSMLDHHAERPGALAHRAVVVMRGDEVAGAADCGRNLVLALEDERDLESLEELAAAAVRIERGRHAVVGERSLVGQFVAAYHRRGARILDERDQILYACDGAALRAGDARGVRPARPRELEDILRAHSAMCLDDLGHDQVADNPEGYRHYFRELIRGARVWVIAENGRIVFKAESSIESVDGAQVEGVYTETALRGRGYATRGMSRVCRDLLRRVPRVTLYVNAHNRAGIRLYEKLGFRRVLDWRTAVVRAG